jgi:predicted Zn-dependent protease
MSRLGRALVVAVAWLAGAAAVFASPQADALAARSAQGAAAMAESRFDEAATIYAELSARRPDDAGLLMNLGMARYMSGDPAGALAPLQKAATLSPTLAPAALFLGASLLDLGRVDDAVPPLARAVKALPDNADAREMLARATMAQSKFAIAAGHYRALTGLTPESPRAWYGLARAYEAIAEDALGALQATAGDSALLELLVADVAVTQDKFAAALSIYRRVMSTTPPPVGGLHELVADLYERAGHPDWAVTERARARTPTPAQCATRVAECHFLAGRFRESLSAAMTSTTAVGRYWTIRAANRLATDAVTKLETLPDSVELHLVRAEIAQSRGQNPESVKEVRAALALNPGNPAIESALAEALLHAHDLDEAIPLLERLNAAMPGDASLLLMLGDALLEQQLIDRAIPVLEQAVKAPDALPHARASLGRAYVQAGRHGEALPHLEAATTAGDATDEVFLQLARAYQALQRPAEARTAMAEYQKRTQQAAPPPDQAPDAVLTPPE